MIALTDTQEGATVATLAEIVAETERVGTEYEAARKAATAGRVKLVPLVVALAKADVPQGDIATMARISRQRVYAIERQAGIVRRMSVVQADDNDGSWDGGS